MTISTITTIFINTTTTIPIPIITNTIAYP